MRTPAARREAMLEFVLRAAEEESERPFPEALVGLLLRVVPCDTVAYRAWSREGRIVDRSFAPQTLAERWPVWLQYPCFRRDDPHPSEPPTREGDPPPVSRADYMGRPLLLSEAVDRRFWRTGLYCELMRPFGIRDVMKVFLPTEGGVASVFVFDTSSHGFGDNDCALITRLVPALVQLQRNARFRSGVDGGDGSFRRLTPRETTVLARVAAGETNAEIAGALFIGPSTVRKHIEHIYDKLEVHNRAAAAALYARRAVAMESGREVVGPPN